jgi:endonuclease IV
MLKAISTHIFLKHRLHAGHLDTLRKSGAEAIEIFANRRHFDYTSRAQVREIGDWFRGNPTPAWALHAPLRAESEGDSERSTGQAINVVHVEKSRRIDSMDEVKRALEAAEQIPFTHLILHLGERGDTWSPRTLEHGMTAVEHLRAFARPLGVQILLENLEKNEVAEPQNLMEILTVGHFDDIGICLDVGHAHIGEGIPATIDIMGTRIRSVHVHDNAGDKDAHLWRWHDCVAGNHARAGSAGRAAGNGAGDSSNTGKSGRHLGRPIPAHLGVSGPSGSLTSRRIIVALGRTDAVVHDREDFQDRDLLSAVFNPPL